MDANTARTKLSLLEQRVISLRNNYNPMHESSFYHLTGSLLFSLLGLAKDMHKQHGCECDSTKKSFVKCYSSLFRYVSWLEHDKFFRDAELGLKHGYLEGKGFADNEIICLQGNPSGYVDEAIRALTQDRKKGF